MKRIILCIVAFILIANVHADQTARSLSTSITKKIDVQYMLHLPKGYDAEGDKEWPLILFLHGAGERGDNLEKVTVHGPPKLAKKGKELGFIIVSPQCPTNQSWDRDTLLTLLDEVEKKHKVDSRRIYLTGLSMGGFGTWDLGLKHAKRFAAIAPICGGGVTIDLLMSRRKKDHPMNKLPIWAFHGAKDTVVLPSESERLVNVLKKNNPRVKLTIYPEANHDSWTATYDNPELYKWFLSHTRK